MPSYELSLKLGKEIQDQWLDAYQEVQTTNAFKTVIKQNLLDQEAI
jgi:hypothetical protein